MQLYLAIQYRGVNGDDATEDEIERNIIEAKAVALSIREHIQGWTLILPHTDPRLEMFNDHYQRHLVSIDPVLSACCELVIECQAMIQVTPVTEGMKVEAITAIHKGIPILTIDWGDPERFEKIAKFLHEIR